jgi:hypothetical protein
MRSRLGVFFHLFHGNLAVVGIMGFTVLAFAFAFAQLMRGALALRGVAS